MTKAQFIGIMGEDTTFLFSGGNPVVQGLNLIAKYLPNSGIEAAEHDEIWACSVEDIVNAGITEYDTRCLANWGWYIEEEESLKHFV